MLADVELQRLVFGGAVVAELTCEGSRVAVNEHVPVSLQLIFELPLANVAVIQELPLSLSGEQPQFIQRLHDHLVQEVVGLFDMLDEVLDVGVFLLAESAVLFDLLMDSLDVDLQVTFAEAAE